MNECISFISNVCSQHFHRLIPVPPDMADVPGLGAGGGRGSPHLDGPGQLPHPHLRRGQHEQELRHLLGHATEQVSLCRIGYWSFSQ